MRVGEGGFLSGLPVLCDERHGVHGQLGGQHLPEEQGLSSLRRTQGEECLHAAGPEATRPVTLRKLWAWEKSLLGWLLSYSFWSRTGMPCHLAFLSLSCSKPPGSCSTRHTCNLRSCAFLHHRRDADFGYAKCKASTATAALVQNSWRCSCV